MTSRTMNGSRSRPLVQQRQISHLTLPPLLIAAPQPIQPQSKSVTQSQSQQQQQHFRAPTPPVSRSSSPGPPLQSHLPHRIPTSASSLLRPSTRQTIAQPGSLIAFLQQHQQQQHLARTYSSTTRSSSSSNMTSDEQIPEIIIRTREAASGTPGEKVEPRQTLPSEDMEPNPANSIPLPPNRQKLVDDVIALYSCQPTIERVARYAPSCVYDDQFVYANDRYKMAGQWFGLPKLFPKSENLGYEIIKNDDTLIQFKNKQRWSFHLISKQATINALVSIVIDPATKDSDFPLVLYHKDQANEKDYSHEGFGFMFKKKQADMVSSLMSSKEVKLFKGDEGAGNNKVNKYGSGTAQAPMSEAAK